METLRSKRMACTVEPPLQATCPQWPGLSESFEVDGWVVKVSGQSGMFYFKNTIYKEMPSRVADRLELNHLNELSWPDWSPPPQTASNLLNKIVVKCTKKFNITSGGTKGFYFRRYLYPFKLLLLLPEVAKIPPTMPHRRTRKPQNDRRRFSTRTMMDDKSYLKKIPKNQTKNERKIMKFLKWILFRSEYKQLHVSVGVPLGFNKMAFITGVQMLQSITVLFKNANSGV